MTLLMQFRSKFRLHRGEMRRDGIELKKRRINVESTNFGVAEMISDTPNAVYIHVFMLLDVQLGRMEYRDLNN